MVNAESTLLSTGVATPLKGIRKVAARRMVQAWQAPVFHLSTEVKMDQALIAAKREPGTTVTDILIKSVAEAISSNPDINAHFNEDTVTIFSEINIGIAVATAAGLVVPVVHDIKAADLQDIAAKRSDIVTRAREGRLSMPDIEGATFTISNLGMLGIDSFDAIVNPPQVAILAIGSTRDIPVVENSEIVIKKVASFTLTCDHRAIDGATGAKFLSELRNCVEKA